jgi:hypothetical protein
MLLLGNSSCAAKTSAEAITEHPEFYQNVMGNPFASKPIKVDFWGKIIKFRPLE